MRAVFLNLEQLIYCQVDRYLYCFKWILYTTVLLCRAQSSEVFIFMKYLGIKMVIIFKCTCKIMYNNNSSEMHYS